MGDIEPLITRCGNSPALQKLVVETLVRAVGAFKALVTETLSVRLTNTVFRAVAHRRAHSLVYATAICVVTL